MTTLVIHPDDRTTDFLIPIYMNLKSFPDFDETTILRGGVSKNEIREMINEYDRVIMLGHGSPRGLFGMGKYEDVENSMIIDESMISALARKKNNIYIWCHANQFVERYYLNGFYSGMFISEVSEALMYSINASQTEVDESNNLFADIVGKNILMEAKNLRDITKVNYYIPGSKVSKYNNSLLNYK
jgi:hypothetical protein